MKMCCKTLIFIDQLELRPTILDHIRNPLICDECESGLQVATDG